MKTRFWRFESEVGVEDTLWVVEVWGAMCWFHWESISCWNSPGMTQQGVGGEKDWLDGWLLFLWDWLASIVEADMLSLRGEDRRGACLVRVDSTDVGGFLRWSRSTSAHWRSCGKWGRFVTWMSQLQTSWEAQRGWRIDGVRRHLSGRLLVYRDALLGGSGAAAVGGVGLLWLEAELLLHVYLVLLPCF